MLELQHPYPRIQYHDFLSYGGTQMQASETLIRQCGCGIVAAKDLVWYLQNYHVQRRNVLPDPLRAEDYNEDLHRLSARYFLLIPHFGINGLFLVAGINRLLRRERLPFRAAWMVSGAKLWERVEQMLQQDFPVIISVGPNFPAFWQKNNLSFYRKMPNGEFRKASAAAAHYVTATGLDPHWLRISSWGVQYYINRAEYDQFVRRHSNYLFSNIVFLTRK